ncbi:MAG: substrate-binding domain-containing protein [Flavobacterium circumlabens]|uniref:LacI family DNA-binding transcriptional regulator n=1 Tax=Flavobacterium circumlabens TaxID=2133765 RepID=A0A4Y7UDH3_9FLAO|nr:MULTISPECIES: substrate-binding domain-containing protein [Flavobacterium]QSB28754.1 substrate-binding domain-containing protein [Flavobacterium sp. CLA17]TCN59120.1 LacI family transcriptional regulator [Flavobacterium circumlabens]TEB44510.1 LacI family DNA-binding transcriptional regulator [Flavobacterium circumlabens]
MEKIYTIKDIAELAGVSKGTVDRVLHKRGKVSQDALDRVNEVLDKIDYQPNLMARSLKKTQIYSICVLLPDSQNDPYWQPCIDGINEAKKEFKSFNVKVEIFLFDATSTASFVETNKAVLNASPDAVLLVPLFHKEAIDAIETYNSKGIISSIFNNQLKSSSIKSFVGQDLFQSGRIAARLLDLLLQKGTIAIIHIDEDYENAIHMQEKEKGFRDYFDQLENRAFEIKTFKVKHPQFKTTLKEYLESNPTISGLFVTTSKAYQVAKIIAKNPERKIALVGYDLLENNLEYLNNKTIDFLIHQNPKRQAYLGTTNLIEHFIFEKEITAEKLLPIDIINTENAKDYFL